MEEREPSERAGEDFCIGLISDVIPVSDNPSRVWNSLFSNITSDRKSVV